MNTSYQLPSPAPGGGAGEASGRICTICNTHKVASSFSIKAGKLRAQCRACRARQESERETARKAAIYAQQSVALGETVQCSQCGETKSVEAFHKSTGKAGHMPFCKACRQKMYLGVGQQNEQGLLRCTECAGCFSKEQFPKRGRICKECKSSKDSNYRNVVRITNPNAIKAKRIAARRYRTENSEACNNRIKAWQKKQRKTNPAFILKSSLLSRLRAAVAGALKTGRRTPFSATQRLQEFIGCTGPELVVHLESQFKPGMSWETYGLRGWHIDHIRPCASFDLTDPEQQQKCFHYKNLQPLWWQENLSKGAKMLAPVCS